MANPVPDVKIVEVVKGLILAAGLASNVAAADVRSAADTLAKQYGKTNHREIEAEIARHLRNKGGVRCRPIPRPNCDAAAIARDGRFPASTAESIWSTKSCRLRRGTNC